MRRRTSGKAKEERDARPIRRAYIESVGGRCEVRAFLSVAARSPYGLSESQRRALNLGLGYCRGYAEGCHELRKRSAGGSLTDPANLLASCNACNVWIEDHPTLAHRLGLVVRRGDPNYEELGA